MLFLLRVSYPWSVRLEIRAKLFVLALLRCMVLLRRVEAGQ